MCVWHPAAQFFIHIHMVLLSSFYLTPFIFFVFQMIFCQLCFVAEINTLKTSKTILVSCFKASPSKENFSCCLSLQVSKCKNMYLNGSNQRDYWFRFIISISLKNKIASYFTSKMSWFENSRGIAIWDTQTAASYKQACYGFGMGCIYGQGI